MKTSNARVLSVVNQNMHYVWAKRVPSNKRASFDLGTKSIAPGQKVFFSSYGHFTQAVHILAVIPTPVPLPRTLVVYNIEIGDCTQIVRPFPLNVFQECPDVSLDTADIDIEHGFSIVIVNHGKRTREVNLEVRGAIVT